MSKSEGNLSNIPVIKKQLSEELQSLEKDIENMDKIKANSIEEIENKKRVLRKLSNTSHASVICEEKEKTLEELEKTNIDITARKLSITQLDQTIAELDEQIAKIQAEHDKAVQDLELKKRRLEELLNYYEELNRRITELNDMIVEAEQKFGSKLQKLLQDKADIKKRTDLTESQMNVLLDELENEINEIRRERSIALACINKQLTDEFQIDVEAFAAQQRKELEEYVLDEHMDDEAFEEGKEWRGSEYQKKYSKEERKKTLESYKGYRISKEDRIDLLRKGLQITPSGHIIVGDRTITLTEAERLGLYHPMDYGEEGEYGESPRWSAEPVERDISYEKLSTISSSTEEESLETVLSSEDIEYLKRNFGKPLTLALAEITAVQPSDPIHYLGHWLFKYRYNQEISEIQRREVQELMIERDRIEAELTHALIVEEARRVILEAIMRAEMIAYEKELARIAAEMEVTEEEEYLPEEEIPYLMT